jgi:hypothetical protein
LLREQSAPLFRILTCDQRVRGVVFERRVAHLETDLARSAGDDPTDPEIAS